MESIVLVIIGLIVGGILVGNDMIEAAKQRAQISQIEEYTTAANTFRLKYNCIPGDCKNAEALGLGSSSNPGANGDGNKRIFNNGAGAFGPHWYVQKERLNFWYHLSQAALIPESYKGYDVTSDPLSYTGYMPVPKLGSNQLGQLVIAVNTDRYAGKNSFYAISLGGGAHRWAFNVMQAYAIDSKIDDGKPFTGKVRDTNNHPTLTTAYSAWHGLGCSGHSITADEEDYELGGDWYTGGWEAIADRPNITRIECGLAFLDRF